MPQVSNRIAWVALLAMGAGFAALEGEVRAGDDCEENVVHVSGTATLELPPAAAYVTLYALGEGPLASDAIRKAKDRADAVVTAVREAAGAGGEIEVENRDLGLMQKQDFTSFGQQTRPQAVRRLTFKFPPDPVRAATALDAGLRSEAALAAPEAGFTVGRSSAVSYGVEDSPELQERLRKEAFADAKRVAEKLAALAERPLGSVVRIGTCDGCGTPDFNMTPFMPEPEATPKRYTSSDPEKVTIRHSLSAGFRLE